MNPTPTIAVYGLWHLGCVTAASLAHEGFQVSGVDADDRLIEHLRMGKPPIFEPGLEELIAETTEAGLLTFTSQYEEGLRDADVVWVTFDTPVDDQDRADTEFVLEQLDSAFPFIKSGAVVLFSSQVPVGFTEQLRQRWNKRDAAKHLIYCYSPENLRLGNALQAFYPADRIVVGLDGEEGHDLIATILTHFCSRLEWMSVASAEMTKHAVNTFLAVSVAMTNEIARICEQTGADAKQVERGLRSEARIGPRAYVSPGAPFAGGTLARDVRFLIHLGASHGLKTPLLCGALASNELHKGWAETAAEELLAGVPDARIAILGLTYKPGTDTVRRSEAVNIALRLADQGREVVFHDPVVAELPVELAGRTQLTSDLVVALAGADLLLVATAWPIYREEINADMLVRTMRRASVIDQSRFLEVQLDGAPGIVYGAVGKPVHV